ncbi:MAG: AMP-binding protein [Spirochaetales bacterium]|nr:AMP-binding protein [Spirochaetales bacterium]MBQ3728426.1 AMP-binding protein [Spirochaetales bacterium]
MDYTQQDIKDAPWLKSYGEVKFHLDYPDFSISDALFESARKYPQQVALTFQDKDTTYAKLVPQIRQAEKAFRAIGIKEGDVVTVCMPNMPQTVVCLYAINAIGAVASMIHPLSAVHEIAFYLKEAQSKTLISIDQFYNKIRKVRELVQLDKIIIARISDALSFVKSTAYKLIKERKFEKYTEDGTILSWKNFMRKASECDIDPSVKKTGKDLAVILFSGGTTGVTKGIKLTNLNFNALALQTGTMCNKPIQGKTMLAAMPMFHGFGLGVCVHTMMFWGGRSYLVPQVSVKGYSKLLKTAQPNYIAGVPTLYEGITRNKEMDNVDLSCLMGVFSGGDSLSIELKKKLDKFLADHGATVRVREGYGTTECVTASCLTPYNKEKEGSIGLPYPDTYYKICKPGTQDEVPFGTDGEICLRGPSVMLGYINHEEENKTTLQKHADGHIWLHTGDMGYMDEDGFIYFKQRIKRMIITSGYNVYPSQIENIIDGMDEVHMSCVIGIPDPYKIQKVKAFVQLAPGIVPSEEIKQKILAYCKDRVAKYAIPYDVEFRDQLPKTLVGKIAYTVLEKEEEEKRKAAGSAS